MDDDKRIRVQITEQQLLCKNRCGFYGTPQWNGLCSHCWRVSQQERKKVKDFQKNKALLSKDEVKKKLSENSVRHSTLKSFLPKSPSLFSPLSSHKVQTAQNHNKSFSNIYQIFLLKIYLKKLKNSVMHFWNYWTVSDDDESKRDSVVSEMVQTLYREIRELFRIKNLNFEEKKISDFMMELENFICIQVYTVLFCTRYFYFLLFFIDRTEEEAADLNFQERVRSLHWVQDFLDEAVTEIVDLNSHRQISKKLDCLIHCSERIFDALKESRSGAPASADEFLPVLIYVILKANPPLIQSNLKFISRFALPYRIMRGESGYYYTNLSCALQFIQDMDAKSLKLTNEEFSDYTNGRRVAPTSNSVVKSIEGSLKRIDEMAEVGERIEEKMNDLEAKIDDNCKNLKKTMENFLTDHSTEKYYSVNVKDEDSSSIDIVNSSLKDATISTPKNENTSEINLNT